MKILLSIFLFFLIEGVAIAQNSDVQQTLSSLKNYKKNLPDQKNKNEGLPAGYENSWKVIVNISRTAVGTTDMSSTAGTCKSTHTGSLNFSISSDFASDSIIAFNNGEEFSLITNPDSKLRPYMRPFKGKFAVSSRFSDIQNSCDANTKT